MKVIITMYRRVIVYICKQISWWLIGLSNLFQNILRQNLMMLDVFHKRMVQTFLVFNTSNYLIFELTFV